MISMVSVVKTNSGDSAAYELLKIYIGGINASIVNVVNCHSIQQVPTQTDLNHFWSCLAVSLGSARQAQEHEGKGGRDQTAPRSHELCCMSLFPSPHSARGRREKREGRREGGRREKSTNE